MIAYQTFCQLRQAWDEQHLTMAQIARALALHPQTVKKWVGRPRYEQRQAARRASILDAHKPAITRWLAQHPFTATQLWQRLREAGYTGGCSIVRAYVRTVRPPRQPAYLTLTYAPGQCAQIDWGSAGAIPVGGTRRALSFFVFVLCHSRWLYVEFTLGQSQEWFLGCQRRAFEALGAVPLEVMPDNCKTAVLSHRVGEAPVCNPHYLDFARHYGFTVKPCGPRQPQAKGRVENAVGYVKKNFLAGRDLAAPGGLAALNAAARLWLETVANVRQHGETKRPPTAMLAEERAHLRPLPANPYETVLVRTVRVSNRLPRHGRHEPLLGAAPPRVERTHPETVRGPAAAVRRVGPRRRSCALVRAPAGHRAARSRADAPAGPRGGPGAKDPVAVFGPQSPRPGLSRATGRAPVKRRSSSPKDRGAQ
jgi:transposase